MAKGGLKCPKCDRTFGMAAHLARHLSAGHGKKKKVVKKKAARRAARTVGKKRGPGRPKGSGKRLGRPKGSGKRLGRPKGKAKRLGRPKGAVSRLGLKDMSLEQLSNVIQAARTEAQRRIVEFQDAIA